MTTSQEYFGTPDKIALMRRSADLWGLLRDSPRFAYYGRTVALSVHGDDTFDILCSLTRLQGGSVCYYFPKDEVPALDARITAAGLTPGRHEHYRGGEASYLAAKALLETRSLPKDLSVVRLDKVTPSTLLEAVADLSQSAGVMAVPGGIQRGVTLPAITLTALDSDGAPVANALGVSMHGPASPRAQEAFWGGLVTRDDRRGEGIAMILGAMVIVQLWEEFGMRYFNTGVTQDNASSQKLCAKLKVFDTDWAYAQAYDPVLLGGVGITR